MLLVSESGYAAAEPLTPGTILQAGMLTKRDSRDFQRAMRVLGKYALVYLLEGKGSFRQAGEPERQVAAGDLILLFPELAHSYGPPVGGYWRELYMVFDGPVFDLWRRHGLICPQEPVRPLPEIAQWRPRILGVLPDQCPADAISAVRAASRLLEVLAAMPRLEHGSALPSTVVPWLGRAKAALEQPAGPEVREIARMLGLSYDLFRKRFAAATGYAPTRYRLLRRIERAGRLIRQGPTTFKEIAAELGFADEFHFAKRFKAVTGMTPGAFRARAGVDP